MSEAALSCEHGRMGGAGCPHCHGFAFGAPTHEGFREPVEVGHWRGHLIEQTPSGEWAYVGTKQQIQEIEEDSK